jgi:hypothetical protein
MARAVPVNLRQLPARRLGKFATSGPVHTQLMAQRSNEDDAIRPLNGVYS